MVGGRVKDGGLGLPPLYTVTPRSLPYSLQNREDRSSTHVANNHKIWLDFLKLRHVLPRFSHSVVNSGHTSKQR